MDDLNKTNPDINANQNASTDANLSVQVLQELEYLIKNHIKTLDERKNELKKIREMLADVLVNNQDYTEKDEEVKKAVKTRTSVKSQIMQSAENKDLTRKSQAIASEIKDIDNALSDYLREYQRLSGSTEIETDDGVIREIVFTAKLVKRSSKK